MLSYSSYDYPQIEIFHIFSPVIFEASFYELHCGKLKKKPIKSERFKHVTNCFHHNIAEMLQ